MTAAGSSTENEVDRELVQKINYKLKSQGYFDQFRKEFIADVDTKPAYKNLQQRVESYVSRFLSQQKWSSDLNKNNLRETLRRQINQSGMLNKGVERIVEQVVNPKILQLIKPKVDEVTCEHLGISLEARNSEMKKKQLAQQEKMMKSPETAGIPSILSLSFNSPPPGSNLNPFGSPVTSLPQSQYTQVPPGTGLLGPAPATSFAQQIANPFSNPAGLTFPGISQQHFPFLPPGWNASLSAGFPPVFPPGLPFQNFSIPPPNATLTVPPPLASGITSSPMVLAVSTTSVTTRPSQGKGLNALLGLPTPSEEPPPPGTVVLPDGTHIHKKKQEDEETERTLPQRLERINTESESSETDQAGLTKRLVAIDSSSENELPFIPLPEGYPSPATKSSMDNQNVEDSTDVDFETEDEKNENADGKRPYKFAWNEEMEINEDEVNDSEVSSVHTCDVSSVHTSDLSEFEESDNEKEKAIEELENKLLLLQNEEGIGHVEEMAVELATEDVEALVEEVEAVEAPVEEETTPTDISFTPAEPSPVKQAPEVTAAPGTGVLKGDGAKPAKPRKLLSLQYNYSDSEDEETREERKERIAKEKEERYQKRLQRRAEMEAKRKEREEERARQKRDRLEQTGGAVSEHAADEGESENIREDEPEIPSDIEAEIEDNDIVETSMTDSEVQEKTVEAEAEAEAEKEKEEAEGPEEVKQDGTDEGEAEAVEETEADEHIVEESTEQKEEAEPEEKEDSPATTESVEPAPVSTDVTERLDQDTSMTAAEMSLTTETSSAHDTSLAEYSSPEKRDGKPRKKTKAELKAELKEQKVKARKSQRQRVRNKRYLSDEFVFKSPPDSSMSQSYDETMLIEETVEMEIDTEPQTIELDSDTVQLLEIPLPQGQVQGPQQITMETVEGLEFTISQDDSEEVLGSIDGATFVTTDGQQFVQSVDFVVTQGDTDSAPGENMPTTRQRSREELKSGASSVGGDLSEDRTGSQESRKKRKRNVSQSSAGGGDKTSPTAGAIEKRQLRSSDSRTDKHGKQPGSKQKYNSDELYKPRHSYSRRALSPPPLPSEPPPIPSDIAPPPLPPSPPPTDSSAPPPPPESPPMEPERSDRGRRSRRKRKNRSRSHSRPRSPKRHKRSSRSHSKPLSVSSGSLSSVSKRSHSSDSKKSYSRKRSKSRSLSSISSDSRRSRSYSKSRSYSRSRSRSRSSSRSRSRSVSRSRSRSISSISSKRSSFSKGSDISFEERERRRKARPLQDIDFGEAAKRARQDSMLPHFAPRGAMGHMGPMGHLGPGGHVGPRGPGSYQMRGMPHMPRGPRGMIRGRYPSPHHMSLDVPPVRAPSLSPSKTYYPPVGGPRYMPPSVAPWEDMHGGRSRQPMYPDDDYYPPEDIHEGPGKTGITERGTLYREDTSPSPPPERRPVYTPPPFREGAVSPPITGITERGTLYREDTSPSVPLPSFYGAVGARPSPPPLRRRRGMEAEPSPPTIRTRLHPSTPSPPPIARRRTISNRSRSQESFESISPSPSPPPPQVMVKAQHFHRPPSPPEQMNTPPVLRRSRGLPASTPSPPSSGELTPSPPDLSHMRGGASPVSPVPMYPASPRGPASPLESLTPSPPPGRERLEPVSPPSPPTPSRLRQGHPPEPSSTPTPSRQRQGQPPEPSSPHYSPESGPPPSLRRSSRNISSSEEEVHYTRSRRGQPPSPPALQRAHRRSLSPLVMPVVETRSRQARGEGKPKKHKRR